HDLPICLPRVTSLVPPWGTNARIAELGADQTARTFWPGRFCSVGATENPYTIGRLPLTLTCRFLLHGVTLWQYVAEVPPRLLKISCDGSVTIKQLSVTVRPRSTLAFIRISLTNRPLN